MLYVFMVKHRATGKLVSPIEAHSTNVENARLECWPEIIEGSEFDDQAAAEAVYELVAVDKVPRQWMGENPTTCDICHNQLGDNGWVDGRTAMGIWGNMCVKREDGNRSCFQMFGVGLGQGRGQQYDGNGWKIGG